MTEFDNVLHCEERAFGVIHAHIDEAFDSAMSGNRHGGHSQRVRQGCVHQDHSFDCPVDEHPRVLFDQSKAPAVAGHKVEVTALQ